MPQSLIQPSFAGGELAPALWARVDLAKYHVGAKTLRNFFVNASGGASNRPGTAYVGRVKDGSHPVRLIPFEFSTVQTYVLEFGHHYLRVVMNGGHVLEPAFSVSAVTQANPCAVTAAGHNFANGDEVFFSGIGGMTALDGDRFLVAAVAGASFQLHSLDGVAVDATAWAAFGGGGTVARVYTLTTPYAGSDLAILKYAQSADVMTLCHPAYPPTDLSRTQHWLWTLTPISFQPGILAPTAIAVTTTAAGSWAYGYVVTALTDDPQEESRASAPVSILAATLNQATGVVTTVTWAPVAGADRYNVYKGPVGFSYGSTTGSIPAGCVYGFIGSSTGCSFTDANIEADTTLTPPEGQDPFANLPIEQVTVTNSGSGYTSPTVTVADPTGSGAVLVAATNGGAIAAITVQNGGANYTGPTVTVTDATGSGATVTATVTSEINYPGCVTYYQQRKIFAGSAIEPESIWMTQSGNFDNMDTSSPSQDSDAITLTVASQQVNAVKNLVSVNALLVLTSSGAFKVSSGSATGVLTPATSVVTPQSFNGCSDVPPLVIESDILYVQSKGSIVRDLTYNFYVDIYTGNDITLMSGHLFFGYQIVDWCWAEEPFKLVWAVRNDGTLLCLTFLKGQDVYPWTRHDTQGAFLSVASVSEGAEDAVYFVVNRTIPGINGGQPVCYVERLASRNFLTGGTADITKAWFVDCGLRYNGAPTTIVSGLGHLEGATVAILADGNVLPPQVVSGGAISLAHAASAVTVGLAYTADLETLNLEVGASSIQGKRKRIAAVTLRLENSRGLMIGYDSDSLVEIKERGTQLYGQPIPLTTGDERLLIPPSWNTEGSVWIRQDNPLPCAVLAVMPEFRLGDVTG